MGSPVDLTLGCSTQAPSSNGYYNHQNEPTHSENYLESLREVEERVRSLEEERRKVEGFKRELPLCIQLLEDGEALHRQQHVRCPHVKKFFFLVVYMFMFGADADALFVL